MAVKEYIKYLYTFCDIVWLQWKQAISGTEG